MGDPGNGPIGIAGAGRLGPALGRLLREAGEPVVAIASRDPGHARRGAAFVGGDVAAAAYSALPGMASRILIAVSDEAIPAVAGMLAAAGMRGVALHTCGALGPAVLAPLPQRGVSCGVLHPLQTIPNAEKGMTALRGIAWGITAEGPAAEWAARIARLLGGAVLQIPAPARPLYHAAAVMACNYLVSLIDAATTVMEAAGVQQGAALAALAPIVETTRRNVFDMGPARALTGPVLRGDAATVQRHLEALAGLPNTVRELYRAAGLHTLAIARRRGLDEDRMQRVEQQLCDAGASRQPPPAMRNNGGIDG